MRVLGLRLRFAILSMLVPVMARAQSPSISYLIPDIGTPGMNTSIEIIAPYNANGSFGTDSLYANNAGDAVRVVCANPSDSTKLTIGPIVVSWHGRVISTQVFVTACASPNSSNWRSLDPSFAVPLTVIVNGVSSNADTFFIVKPNSGLNVSGGGAFGSGGQWGIRSKRGALIFDSITLGGGTYTVSTTDCDPFSAGNQGYLPANIISRGPVSLSATATLSVSATGKDGGPGGGGGSMGDGPTTDIGGSGYVGGSPGESAMSKCPATGGTGTGGIGDVNTGGVGLNGINTEPSDVPQCEYFGGTGNPFVSAGGGVLDHNKHEGDGNGGGFATPGQNGRGERGSSPDLGGIVNGNQMLVPLMGGSGGGGANEFCTCASSSPGAQAGGGGGAVLLFATQIVAGSAQLQSNGGVGVTGGVGCVGHGSVGGCGSGGGVTFESKLASSFPSVSVVGGASSHTHADAGNGGAGRVRFDGPYGASGSITPNNATVYRGLSTDTTSQSGGTVTLTGTGNGNPIRLYSKSGGNPWQLVATVSNYLGNAWSQTLTIDPSSATYLVALQQVPNPSTNSATLEPSWVMSQAATNIIGNSNTSTTPSLRFNQASIRQPGCVAIDTTVRFWVESCGLTVVFLDTAWLTGSPNFSLLKSPSTPRQIFGTDSESVQYQSTSTGHDTALIHLRYRYGSTISDTTILLIGSGGGGPTTLAFDRALSIWARCSGIDTLFPLSIAGCLPGSAKLDSLWLSGSSAFQISDIRTLPRTIRVKDSVRLHYGPVTSTADTSWLHLRYDLGNGVKDTTIELLGTNRSTPVALDVNPDAFIWSVCVGVDTSIPLTITGCQASFAKLDTIWMDGSSALVISDTRSVPRILRPKDSVLLRYRPAPNGSDTSRLHIRYDLGAGPRDTIIELFGANRTTPTALSLLIVQQAFQRTACTGVVDTTIPLGILGCLPSTAKLDSLWLGGSSNFHISDLRKIPRTLSVRDSIRIRYTPWTGLADTGLLHLRYDIGNGWHDTTVVLLGSSSSPFIGSTAYQHLAIRSGSLNQLVTMPLMEDISDSIFLLASWGNLNTITATISFDPSKLTYQSYNPPAGWTTASVTPNGNNVQFTITKGSSVPTHPLDMGAAVFQIHDTHPGMTLVMLNDLRLHIGQSDDEVCLSTSEDEMWGIEILPPAGVSESSSHLIRIRPNPFEDRILIDDPEGTLSSVEIVDVLGRSRQSERVRTASAAQIETFSLPPGTYFVICHTADQMLSFRMTKAR